MCDFAKSKRKVKYDSSCLKKQITLKELTQTIKRLKKGKATGLDRISNEMLIFGFNFLKDSVLKLFNLIFISRCTSPPWSLGLISPIYKSGNKMDPDNYRGVFVINCLSKLFLLILNQRLSSFVNTYKIINRSQIGFPKGKRTSDHIFSLKTIINKHVSSVPRGEIYMCFVDKKSI